MSEFTYAASGVDIDAGERAVTLMRAAVERTNRPEVVGGLGGFAGLFALDTAKYRAPLLASSTDGVGTKIALARVLDRLARRGDGGVRDGQDHLGLPHVPLRPKEVGELPHPQGVAHDGKRRPIPARPARLGEDLVQVPQTHHRIASLEPRRERPLTGPRIDR